MNLTVKSIKCVWWWAAHSCHCMSCHLPTHLLYPSLFHLVSILSSGSLACFLLAISSVAVMLLELLVFPLLLLVLTLHLSKLPWMIHPGWSAPVFSAHPIFSFSTYHGIYSFRRKDEDQMRYPLPFFLSKTRKRVRAKQFGEWRKVNKCMLGRGDVN